MSDPHEANAIVLQSGEWETESQKYPAFRLIETARREQFDAQDRGKLEEFYTEDFSVLTPHAEHHTSGREDAFHTATDRFYTDSYRDFKHFPYHAVSIETKDGYEVYLQCNLFVKIKGDPVGGEKRVKDPEAKEWDAKVPVFYHFSIIKDNNAKHGGLKISDIKIMKDTGAVIDIRYKRSHGRN